MKLPINNYIENYPNICPFCKQHITPDPLFNTVDIKKEEDIYHILFYCPNKDCSKPFIGIYDRYNRAFLNLLPSPSLEIKTFPEIIDKISKKFSKIYNEAYTAEQTNCFEICGIGYRKALEFLVKDYAINTNSDDSENIKKQSLGQCIDKYMTNPIMKGITKRATWLGNDETHYERKFEERDLKDLKDLLEITIHLIVTEIKTKQFLEQMQPQGKQKSI